MRHPTSLVLALSIATAAAAQAPWLNMVNESSSRLVANSSLLVNDNTEKDLAFGDFNHDGWIDVVVVRKFPGSTQGGFRNILFMNEGGVLVDRTVEYASTSDVAGYQGFLDPTNDRDVVAVDINNDGWLDLVTATTMSDQVNDILGQPRAYINLGVDASGKWLGFRHERNRIPHIYPPNGNPTANPRFCAVAAGDFNGDGYVDLFFVDYDTPETGGLQFMDFNDDGDTSDPGESQNSPAETVDFNNKLLFNWGAAPPGPGYFYDTTTTVCTSTQLDSAFGNAVCAADFNGDGKLDIARVSTLGGSPPVGILTRKASGTGFLGLKAVYTGSAYNTEAGDLNGDGKMDLVVTDDGQDRYLINTGNDAQGQPNFDTFVIGQSASEFGNQIRIFDWDKDGKNDVIIVDPDADLPSFCPTTGRRTHIYRNVYNGNNNGILVESNASFSKPFTDAQLQAWFDVAPVDIDNDGWPDMVVGRCSGIEVWMNRPVSIAFSYPNGRPSFVAPGAAFNMPVTLTGVGNGSLVPSSAALHYSVNGGPWVVEPLTADADSATFTATFPSLSCHDRLTYYISGNMTTGGPYTDPSNAPYGTNVLTVGSASTVVLNATFESGLDGFTITNTAIPAGMKGWEVAAPNPTTLNGKPWAPGAAAAGSKALVTMNGAVGGAASASDLDGGPTIATSATFSLAGVDHPVLSYSRWYACDDTLDPNEVDPLFVEISNDGGANWVLVEKVDSHGNNLWKSVSFQVDTLLALTSNMQLRFRISDNPDNSITEAAIDSVLVAGVSCTNPCPADLDGDHLVGGADLGLLLANWAHPGTSDLNGDGTTDGADLGSLLAGWGACP